MYKTKVISTFRGGRYENIVICEKVQPLKTVRIKMVNEKAKIYYSPVNFENSIAVSYLPQCLVNELKE